MLYTCQISISQGIHVYDLACAYIDHSVWTWINYFVGTPTKWKV